MAHTNENFERSAGRVGSVALDVSLFKSFEDFEAIAGEWDELVARCGGDIYFTSGWLRVWWEHYGHGRELCSFLIRDSEQAIAALPFSIERLGVGSCSVRLARFVGADSTISVFSPAHRIWK